MTKAQPTVQWHSQLRSETFSTCWVWHPGMQVCNPAGAGVCTRSMLAESQVPYRSSLCGTYIYIYHRALTCIQTREQWQKVHNRERNQPPARAPTMYIFLSGSRTKNDQNTCLCAQLKCGRGSAVLTITTQHVTLRCGGCRPQPGQRRSGQGHSWRIGTPSPEGGRPPTQT